MLAAPLRALAPAFRQGVDYLRQDVPPDIARPGDWLARLEQRGYLSSVLLRDIDAMSMAHSLEVRVPFLDRALSDAASDISWQLKLRDGVGKWVLKHALRDLLPDEILFRPKMGFGLPYQVWMRRSLEPIVRDTLTPARIRRRGVFDPGETASLVDRFYRGDDNVWRRVWTLFILEGWATEVLDARPDRILLLRSGRHLQVALAALDARFPGVEVAVVATPGGERAIRDGRRAADHTFIYAGRRFTRRSASAAPRGRTPLALRPGGRVVERPGGDRAGERRSHRVLPGAARIRGGDAGRPHRGAQPVAARERESRRAAASLVAGPVLGLLFLPGCVAGLRRQR